MTLFFLEKFLLYEQCVVLVLLSFFRIENYWLSLLLPQCYLQRRVFCLTMKHLCLFLWFLCYFLWLTSKEINSPQRSKRKNEFWKQQAEFYSTRIFFFCFLAFLFFCSFFSTHSVSINFFCSLRIPVMDFLDTRLAHRRFEGIWFFTRQLEKLTERRFNLLVKVKCF